MSANGGVCRESHLVASTESVGRLPSQTAQVFTGSRGEREEVTHLPSSLIVGSRRDGSAAGVNLSNCLLLPSNYIKPVTESPDSKRGRVGELWWGS